MPLKNLRVTSSTLLLTSRLTKFSKDSSCSVSSQIFIQRPISKCIVLLFHIFKNHQPSISTSPELGNERRTFVYELIAPNIESCSINTRKIYVSKHRQSLCIPPQPPWFWTAWNGYSLLCTFYLLSVIGFHAETGTNSRLVLWGIVFFLQPQR